MVLSVWFTWGIWATGVPAGDDTAAHYVRTQYAIDNLFANGLLDGWQSSFGLGYQEFLFVGPGFTVVAALLKVLSIGGLSTVDAFKLTVVLSFVALPLAADALAVATVVAAFVGVLVLSSPPQAAATPASISTAGAIISAERSFIWTM